jgi:hypothetical protein
MKTSEKLKTLLTIPYRNEYIEAIAKILIVHPLGYGENNRNYIDVGMIAMKNDIIERMKFINAVNYLDCCTGTNDDQLKGRKIIFVSENGMKFNTFNRFVFFIETIVKFREKL